MKTNMTRGVTFGVTLFLAIASPARAMNAFSGAWTKAAESKLNATTDIGPKAAALLRRIIPDLANFPVDVQEALFVDVDGDGKPELVATVDFSGRGFFNNLYVVKQVGSRYQWSDLQGRGYSIDELKTRLVDLNGDGRMEFIRKDFIDRYEGAIRVPTQVLVYEWRTDRYVDASKTFANYYRDRVVPDLQKRVAAIDTSSTSSRAADQDEDEVLRVELARAKMQSLAK